MAYHENDVIFTEESLIAFIKCIHDNIGDNYHFVSTIEMARRKKNNENFNDDQQEIATIFQNNWETTYAGCICIINQEYDSNSAKRYLWVRSGDQLEFENAINHGALTSNPFGTFIVNRNYKSVATDKEWVQIKGFDNTGNFDNSNAGDNIYIKSDILLATTSLGKSGEKVPNAYITDAYITNLKSTLSSNNNITINSGAQLIVKDTTEAGRGSTTGINAGNDVSTVYGSINTLGGIAAAKTIKGKTVHAAVFNDYAECRKTISLSPGHVVIDQDDGSLVCASARLQPGAQVISDTYGNLMGETNDCQTPIAVAGRVLVYPYQNRENYHAGMAVCSASNGTVDIMTREEIRDYPDCIVGIVSEIPQYEKWGSNQVDVDGRIWIKVK